MPQIDVFLNRRYTQMSAELLSGPDPKSGPDKNIDALKGIPLVAVAFSAQCLHTRFYYQLWNSPEKNAVFGPAGRGAKQSVGICVHLRQSAVKIRPFA